MVIRDGKVAIQHYSTNPSPPFAVGEDTYQSAPRYNVSLMWVKEEHVDWILSQKVKGCDCGNGATKPRFFIASEINVSIHETGDKPH